MTIVFVNENCGWFGGVEQNIALTATALRAAGHDCQLVYRAPTENEPARFQTLFSACHHCPGMGNDPAALVTLLHSLAPDVVYVHKVPHVPPIGSLPPRTACVRMLHDHDVCCPRRHKYFVHTARICRHPLGWRCWLDLAFLARDRTAGCGFRLKSIGATRRELLHNTALDALIVGSTFMRDELCMNGFPPSHVHVLPPTVPSDDTVPTPPSTERRILYIGQLIRGKGVDLLLRAVARVPGAPVLDVVGTGNARPALERMAAQLGLRTRVRFHGWCDPAATKAFYRAACVVAVPSRWPEPFGMVGIEAMRHARPVVAFAAGGIPDWCSDGVTGLLVPEQDIAGFANALTRVLDDPSLAGTLGANGHAHARTLFSFDQYVARLAALLAAAHQEKCACASA